MPEEKEIKEQQPAASKFDWKRMLNYKWIEKNIPFFLFLALLAVIYIYNGHYADKMVRKISATEKHIKELEYEYKTIKSEVIFRSKASELENVVKEGGLKALTTAPVLLGASAEQQKK